MTKAKTGRPSSYTPEIAAEICGQLIEGLSLRQICRDEAMPSSSMVFRWLAKHEEFREQYAIAKMEGCEAWADEIVDIADNQVGSLALDDNGHPVMIGDEYLRTIDNTAVNHAKLRVDSRKWVLAKMMPKKYGDKIFSENTTRTIDMSNLTDEQLDEIINESSGSPKPSESGEAAED